MFVSFALRVYENVPTLPYSEIQFVWSASYSFDFHVWFFTVPKTYVQVLMDAVFDKYLLTRYFLVRTYLRGIFLQYLVGCLCVYRSVVLSLCSSCACVCVLLGMSKEAPSNPARCMQAFSFRLTIK